MTCIDWITPACCASWKLIQKFKKIYNKYIKLLVVCSCIKEQGTWIKKKACIDHIRDELLSHNWKMMNIRFFANVMKKMLRKKKMYNLINKELSSNFFFPFLSLAWQTQSQELVKINSSILFYKRLGDKSLQHKSEWHKNWYKFSITLSSRLFK